jgi:hypothetical protein
MRMDRCRCARRPMAVVHTQQILGRAERRNRPDLRDLRSTGRRAALWTESEEPRFAGNLSCQRRQSVIADSVRIPAIGWCSSLRFIQRRETLDAPKQFAVGKLLTFISATGWTMYCACAATGEGANKSPIPKENESAKITTNRSHAGMSDRIVFLGTFTRTFLFVVPLFM